jgi:molybdenum cofactor synthesis domain-containing protein
MEGLKGARAGILTVSDSCSRGEREDASGPALQAAARACGLEISRHAVVPDDRQSIASMLRQWCDDGACDLILTTGGTGFSPTDCTPEAMLEVVEKWVPGLSEMIRLKSSEKVQTSWLSRGTAGIRSRTLIVNLPGSRKAVEECFAFLLPLLPHALEVLTGRAYRCGG